MTQQTESNGLVLPWRYAEEVQSRLNKRGILVSTSLIHKVRRKHKNNFEVLRTLKELSDEYKILIESS